MRNPIIKPSSRIAITADDPEMIAALQNGFESREFIDLYSIKFAGINLTINPGIPELAVLRAEEVRMIAPLPWSGAGLPPVGTVCECKVKAGSDWVQCEVVAHHKNYAIAYVDDDTVMLSCGIRFRPIRTEAQLAADRRHEAIEKACALVKNLTPGARDAIGNLYDAGLLKGEEHE